MMLIAQANFEIPLVFAGLVALAVEGIGMYAIMAFIEKRMTGWAPPFRFCSVKKVFVFSVNDPVSLHLAPHPMK